MLQDGGVVVEGEDEEELRKSWSTKALMFGGTPPLDDIVNDKVVFM